jgi:flagellar FliL protein
MAKKPEKKPEADQAEPAAKASSGGGGMMGLLMIGGASLVSSFGHVYLLTPQKAAEATACAPAEAAATVEPIVQADQVYVPLDEMLITVGSSPANRYLKLNISVITTDASTAAVEEAKPVLIDAFNTYLRSIELKDFEDPGFYPRMREQLARRAELVLGSGVSNGVLITEFLLR